MSQSIETSREAQRRMAEAMTRYRDAWGAVEEVLARRPEVEGQPRWVFALERSTLDELRAADPELAQAEEWRRKARVALHCLVDLLSLEQLPGVNAVDWEPPEPAITSGELTSLERADDGWRSGLDRFIGIVDYARSCGVIYLNGTFVPVEAHHGRD